MLFIPRTKYYIHIKYLQLIILGVEKYKNNKMLYVWERDLTYVYL